MMAVVVVAVAVVTVVEVAVVHIVAVAKLFSGRLSNSTFVLSPL
jgi:hypothetical protein